MPSNAVIWKWTVIAIGFSLLAASLTFNGHPFWWYMQPMFLSLFQLPALLVIVGQAITFDTHGYIEHGDIYDSLNRPK